MKQFRKSTAYKTILLLIILFQVSVLKAQVGINQPNPDSTAILDLKSNNKGVLMPRLTSAQIQSIKNPDPSEGLLVYCIDLKIFCYYDGANWISLPAWGQKLDLADPSAPQNINAKENANSNVGIGTDTPESKLTVLGNLTVGNDTAATANGAYIKGQVKVGSAPDPGDTEKVEVDGNINANGKLKEYGDDLLPAGAIIMWNGTNIPDGWALCDGNPHTYNGKTTTTPNFSGRFIVAAGTRKTTTLNQDGTVTEGTNSESFNIGPGNEKATDYVKLSTTQMPSHSHPNTASSVSAATGIWIYGEGDSTPEQNRVDIPDPISGKITLRQSVLKDPKHVHEIIMDNKPNGSNIKHENRPPYYVLAFIIKL